MRHNFQDQENLLFVTKGGLISECFSLLLKSPKKDAKSHLLFRSWIVLTAQNKDLTPFLGDNEPQ